MGDINEEEKTKWKKIVSNMDQREMEYKRKKFINDEKNQWTTLSLRIPRGMVNDIDICVKSRIGMNRTAWILEAIQDKLKREKKNE